MRKITGREKSLPLVHFEDMEVIGERYARDAVTGERYKLPKDTTYKQWKEMQDAAHGAGTVDKMRKMSYNESADQKQFDAYKARLGDEAPNTFEDFQKLKYDSPTAYNDLCGLYSYKGRVPEATKADYGKYKAVKATGVYGSVRVPPKYIDVKGLTFKDEHGEHHGCTLEQAIGYIENAKCSITRKRWDGYHTNYYAMDGATYVSDKEGTINTAFMKKDFDPTTNSILEVFQ